MIDKQKKYEILARILENEEFRNSDIIKKLLSYLVDCSVTGRVPKEFTIAKEVFNKASDFDPAIDTTVRVYVHRLRKKLDFYFKTQAKQEKIRMLIPKGKYELHFASYEKNKKVSNKYILVVVLLLVYIIISHLFIIFNPVTHPSASKLTATFFWSNLFKSDKPRLVVLGDHFFYEDFRTHTIQRRDYINSKEDFYFHFPVLDSTSKYYWILPYTFFPKNSIWPFQQFQSSLLVNQKYEFKAASQVTAADLDNFNILFVGSFHTLGILKETFRNSHFQFMLFPNSITITDRDSTYVIQETGNPTLYHYDYGVVRKIPGPKGNMIYIFSGFHETGIIGITQYFTNPANLEEMESLLKEKYQSVPLYFELLFEATGYNRTNFSTEIKYIFKISTDQHL